MLHFNYGNPVYQFHDSDKGLIKRFVGVEIEVADFTNDPSIEKRLEDVIAKWGGTLKGDGSVHGTHPFEINTAPARGQQFVKQIREICGVLREGKAGVNRTCGLHVHIDARDFAPNDLLKVAMVWRKVESQAMQRVAPSRRANGYCLPASAYIENALSHNTIDAFYNLSHAPRHMALNCSSYNYKKTLENRLHHGTTNSHKIISWARLNSKMVEFAKNHSLEEIKTIPNIDLNQFEPQRYPIAEANEAPAPPTYLARIN